jgi:hypothetical protein
MVGCGLTRPRRSPFLGDIASFKTHPTDKDTLVYINETNPITEYDKFLMDPVLIYYDVDTRKHPIQSDVLKQFSDALREELVNAFIDGYEMVEGPGPGVVRIRAAIMDLPALDYQINSDGFLSMRVDWNLSLATIQLEAVDSLTGDRVHGLIKNLQGPHDLKGEEQTLRHVRASMRDWMKVLRQRLDKAREDEFLN